MASADRRGARLAGLLSFSSFFVFPAIAIGHTGAITIPFVIAAALAALWLPRLRLSEWAPCAWLLVPALVSGGWVLLVGTALAPEIVPKSIAALAMSLLVIVPARRLLRAGHGESFLLGAAAAILVHAALGAWQVRAFDRGEFPFVDLLRTNPAMSLLAEDPENYAEWVKRPFGLFAEASAMAACIGPWLVLLSAALFGRTRRTAARSAFLAAALASGTWLVVASRSGLAAPIVGAIALTLVGTALSWRGRPAARAVALCASAAVAVASAVWLSEHAGSRFELDQNDSWQARLESLKVGVRSIGAANDSAGRFLVGVGPGQSYPALNRTSLRYEAAGGVTAVWSVGVNYAMETGLLGILAALVGVAVAGASIWSSRARLAGAAFALVWLSGVTAGTSYVGQPALWTGLAALLSWRRVAPRA
jgi:hypothetical protein